MRIYISGPMTGIPQGNVHAFSSAAVRLRERGHFVINPAELSATFGSPAEMAASFDEHYRMLGLVEDYLNRTPSACVLERTRLARAILDADLAAVRSCDAIYLLRGWETSRGARKELAEALAHNLTILQERTEA